MQPKTNNCAALHQWARSLPRHRFPFSEKETRLDSARQVPKNGIYLLFEKGEHAHGGERLVRAGTHTGEGQLPSRLRQHFVMENKDRSIFRKNIGRALLNKKHDPYAAVWELDFTSAAARKTKAHLINLAKQQKVEKEITKYLQNNFSFVVIEIKNKKGRLQLESKIISTLSHCENCKPSKNWLGNYSPKEKIRESGLWLVNELYKEPLSKADMVYLQNL
jgi:hypothetical protein